MNNILIVSTWRDGKKGSEHLKFGLSIRKKDKSRFLNIDSKEFILEIDNVETIVKLRDVFWGKCSEIVSKDITNFVNKNKLTDWPITKNL